jgi:hypothetical protein
MKFQVRKRLGIHFLAKKLLGSQSGGEFSCHMGHGQIKNKLHDKMYCIFTAPNVIEFQNRTNIRTYGWTSSVYQCYAG